MLNNIFTLLTSVFMLSGIVAQQSITLELRSGVVILNQEKVQLNPTSEELMRGYAYRIVSFDKIPTGASKENLTAIGVELLNYLPENNFYARIQVGITDFDESIVGITSLDRKSKLTAELNADFIPDWAFVEGNRVRLNAAAFETEVNPNLKKELESIGVTSLTSMTDDLVTFEIGIDRLEELYSMNEFYFFECIEEPSTPVNADSRTSHGSNGLDGENGYGLQFDGSGINIMMTDDGYIGEHIDYKGRIDQSYCAGCSTSPNNTHADHVAGTIMGAGNVDPRGQGMALGSKLFVANAASGFGAFDNYVSPLYFSDSLVLTSRSYRNGCGGTYNNRSAAMDQQTREHPSLLHVAAAANEGAEDCGYGVTGWGNISDAQQAGKNVLVVGALNKNNGIAGFSSRGPLEDGRLKPDICGVGVSVFSAQPGNDYASWQGTSMSTPGVSGTMAQLYEAYKSLNGGQYPKSGLMKAVVMNSAVDLGNDGPDFIYGYGKINAQKAYKTLDEHTYFTDSLAMGENDSYFISVPNGTKELRVMIYWTDYEATPSASNHLVNDLNLVVTDPTMASFNPWVLDHTPDVAALSAPAVRTVDDMNNAEQVTIDDPVPGNYEINIDGFSVPEGPQEYFIIYQFVPEEVIVTYPNGGEGLEAGPVSKVRWDASDGVDDFVLDYTIDDGATWVPMATVGPDVRQYNWYTPSDIISGLSRVRITRGTVSDISDSTFTIADSPDNLTIEWACPDSLKFVWDTVNFATQYEVSELGAMFMDSIGTTTATSMVLQIPATDTTWLSARTLGTNNARSQRSVSIQKLPGQWGCTWSNPVSLFSIECDTLAQSNCAEPINESANVDGSSTYLWYFPNGTPATSTLENPTVCYSNSGYHDAALVVTNSVGTDSIYLTDYIYVRPSREIPYFESFELYDNFGSTENWSIVNGAGNGFAVNSASALSGVQCAKLQNYGQPEERVDQLISGPVDLSVVDTSLNETLTLSFRYAYRKRLESNDEWLRLRVRNGCDAMWATRRTIHGNALSDQISPMNWAPGGQDDWVTVHVVNITATYFVPDFQFMFEFTSDLGNNLYIDDINIYIGDPSDTLVLGLEETSNNSLTIYPNPADEQLNVLFNLETQASTDLFVTDLNGKTLVHSNFNGQPGANLVQFDTFDLESGFYFVHLVNASGRITKKVEIIH